MLKPPAPINKAFLLSLYLFAGLSLNGCDDTDGGDYGVDATVISEDEENRENDEQSER